MATVTDQRQRRRSKLDPGKGLLDWIKLCRKYKQQNNTEQLQIVNFEELQRHNSEDDCWIAFRGEVYEITHYLTFHPGGKSQLMRAAGTDCTLLFNQVHSHVNLSSLLVTFRVGTLASFGPLSLPLQPSESFLNPGSPLTLRKLNVQQKLKLTMDMDISNCNDTADGVKIASPVYCIDVNKNPPTPNVSNDKKIANSMAIPEIRSRRTSREQRDQLNVKHDWHQTNRDIVITLSGHNMVFSEEKAILYIDDCVFEAKILVGNWCYNMNIALEQPVSRSKVLLVDAELQIILEKATKGINWSSLGVLLPGNAKITPWCSEIDGIQYMKCTLKSVSEVNYNTKIFTFKLPGASHMIIPTGYHVSIKAKQNSEASYLPTEDWVERSYTPILPLTSDCNNEGSEVELMVKLYRNGAMSSILSSLCNGDMMHISYPLGNFTTSQLNNVDHVTLIAAGSGFTPMVKLIKKVCNKNSESTMNKTAIKLLFFNKTAKDIMWSEELQSLSKQDCTNFRAVHILSHARKSWTGYRGRVGRRILQDHMPPATDKHLICVCGQSQFTHTTISTLLDIGFKENSIHAFD